MYAATATAVKTADPSALVGGDAAAIFVREFNTSFLNFLQANPQMPLDFFSYHTYFSDDFNTSAGTGGAVPGTVRGLLDAAGRRSAKLYVTEWNHTVPDQGPGNGSDTNVGERPAFDGDAALVRGECSNGTTRRQ